MDAYSRFLSLRQIFSLKSCAYQTEYHKWDSRTRYTHITAVTLLTALLYVIFSQLDSGQTPDISQTMRLIHLYIIAPALLLISYLALRRKAIKLILGLLFLSPILAASGHIYLASLMPECTIILAEEYLMVFWIFAVSGMPFLYALASAIIVATMFLVFGYGYTAPNYAYHMHAFWIFCSFTFGLLGSVLFEKSRRINFVNYDKQCQLAVTDALTGLYNRSHMEEVLSTEIQRCERYETGLGMLLLDIDHFKEVNDTYGHQIGDRVLIEIAGLLKCHARATDILIRWGGEEFVIIYLNVDSQTLLKIAQELRIRVLDYEIDPVGSKTISIGGTIFRSGDTTDSMLHRADQALYKAKELGRNRVELL